MSKNSIQTLSSDASPRCTGPDTIAFASAATIASAIAPHPNNTSQRGSAQAQTAKCCGAPRNAQPQNPQKKLDMPRTTRVPIFRPRTSPHLSFLLQHYKNYRNSGRPRTARVQNAYVAPPAFWSLVWVKSAAWRCVRRKPAQCLGSRMWPFPPNPKLSGPSLRNVGVPQEAPSAAQTWSSRRHPTRLWRSTLARFLPKATHILFACAPSPACGCLLERSPLFRQMTSNEGLEPYT